MKTLLFIWLLIIPLNSYAKNDKEMSGGDTTIFDQSSNAYSHEIGNFYKYNMQYFAFGNNLFNTKWVPAPNQYIARNGLGPLYNQPSCASCHFKDGRGRPPLNNNEPLRGLLFRLSIPGTDSHGGPNPHPVYGGQLQDKSIDGVKPEGNVKTTYDEVTGTYDDGEKYSLRKPIYEFIDLNYGPLGDNTLFSPRVAPPVFGLGLLEAIPERTMQIIADEQLAEKNGVHGRINYVWNHTTKKKAVGRFGWKANQPTIAQQVASAFSEDMGITSFVLPSENCTELQTDCTQSTHSEKPEIESLHYRFLNNYILTLGVPARRNIDDPEVKKGGKIFTKIGCSSCHRTNIKTSIYNHFTESDKLIDKIYHYTEFSNQTIHPYTDLLLHDMGEELSDNRPDFLANGKEWRTPPLWGIGLTEKVNGHSFFLHDGRARNLEEAILWHGGESKNSINKFKALTKENRQALLRFLESL